MNNATEKIYFYITFYHFYSLRLNYCLKPNAINHRVHVCILKRLYIKLCNFTNHNSSEVLVFFLLLITRVENIIYDSMFIYFDEY